MKTGRNDKCPCGSDKKYKKCCIDKGNIQDREEDPIESFFEKYNSVDLLRCLSALSLDSRNHGKYMRLETLTSHILANPSDSVIEVPYSELKSYLDKNYSYDHNDDPPTNLFTDLVTFHGGDYIVFPGILEKGSYDLNMLLMAIFHYPDTSINQDFKKEVNDSVLALLTMSNVLASRIDLERYENYPSLEETEISFPIGARIDLLKNAITFSEEELIKRFDRIGVDVSVLDPFIIDPATDVVDQKYGEESDILKKPLIKTGEWYVVLQPTLLLTAISEKIKESAIKHKCLEEVNNAYYDTIWNDCKFHLRLLGFEQISLPNTISLPDRSLVCSIDSDKLAIVTFNNQDGINNVIEELKGLEAYNQYLDLNIYANWGMDRFMMEYESIAERTLTLGSYELEIIYKLQKSSALDIWNFAELYQENRRGMLGLPAMMFTVLDYFGLYKAKKDSFYMNDDPKSDFIMVLPGDSSDLIFDAIWRGDKHSISRFRDGRLTAVPVEKKDEYTPIYLNRNEYVGGKLSFALEGYNFPIWIEPITSPGDKQTTFLCFQLNDAIGYWLWQMTNHLKEKLSFIAEPLTIRYDFDKDAFTSIEYDVKRDKNLDEKWVVVNSVNEISITIPNELIPYLYGSENESDRSLCRAFLKGFNAILNAHGKPLIDVEALIEEVAPLGNKKKWFVLNLMENPLLDARGLNKHRYIQDYNTGKILDSIVPLLGDDCPNVGIVSNVKEKKDLLHKIVQKALFPQLLSEIKKYDYQILLSRLVPLNESLIKKREEDVLHTTTRIACFVEQQDHVIDIQKGMALVSETAVSVRGLIELVGTEQHLGDKKPSQTDIDELISLMAQNIKWGSIGDLVHFDTVDLEVSILESGRIGLDHGALDEIFKPFSLKKASERVTDSIKIFNANFKALSDDKPVQEVPNDNYMDTLNDNFVSDHNISLSRIYDLIAGIYYQSLENPQPYYLQTLSELRESVNRHAPDFEEEEFSAAIEYLSLRKRDSITKLPLGYDGFYDIMPWKYNRRLSLNRKPLVYIENENGEDQLLWGTKQVYSSANYLQEQLVSDRFRSFDGSKVKESLGVFAKKRGDNLVESTIKIIENKDILLFSELFIRPKGPLKNEIDIGDVDILIVDKANQTVFSVEGKSMSATRSMKEVVGELEKLFGSEGDSGWVGKHIRREDWLNENKDKVSQFVGLDITDYKIQSIFLTDEEMIAPHIPSISLPFPFITYYDIEELGYKALLNTIL